jgi:sugar/nucleoside kinase (ribokinase family)
VENALGGSATYFSLAARLLSDVRLVGVVGRDFPEEHVELLRDRQIDTAGLQVTDGKTFRWTGAYEGDMNEAETLAVELNVLATFDPKIPDHYNDSRYVFLANGSPSMQRAVTEALPDADLVVCDTMNFWIENALEDLKGVLRVVDGVVLNDREARMLTGRNLLVNAGRDILEMGPSFVVIKKGEHGAMLITNDEIMVLPAFPTGEVKDPTGAGDSFAGGFMGRIAATGNTSFAGLKEAVGYATAVASMTVEGFGVSRISCAGPEGLDARLGEFRRMLEF